MVSQVTIGTSGCASALAGADEEAEQPEHEEQERDPPQGVEDEPQAAQEQGEQEHEQDERHQTFLSVAGAQVRLGMVQAHVCCPRRVGVFHGIARGRRQV